MKNLPFSKVVTLDTSHWLMLALKFFVLEKTHFRFVTNFIFQFSIVPYFATTSIFLWPPAIHSSISFAKPDLCWGLMALISSTDKPPLARYDRLSNSWSGRLSNQAKC